MDANAAALLLGWNVGSSSRHHLQTHPWSRWARSGVYSEPSLRLSSAARRAALGIVPLGDSGGLRRNCLGSLDRSAAFASDRCGDGRPALYRSGHHELPLVGRRDRWSVSGHVDRLDDGSSAAPASPRESALTMTRRVVGGVLTFRSRRTPAFV